MIKIIIADDHPVVRFGMTKIVSKDPDIVVVGEAQSSHEVMELMRTRKVDVVVLDISMPGRSGLEILEQLKCEYPKIPVLILSMHSEEQYAVMAFKTGAAGYLTKKSALEELIMAIRKVASGGRYASTAFDEHLLLTLEKGMNTMPHETLTNRELHVMHLIVSGKKPKTIAEELFLSVKTVNTYRVRILQKLQVKSNAELIRYALENKLFE
jgi:DNA-binding NarL/FixJ family response regulator